MNGDGEEQRHSAHGVQEQLIGSTGAPAVLSAADDNTDPSPPSLEPPTPSSPPTPPARPHTAPVQPSSRDWRRRSADVGGLHLATMGLGQGQGWMGGDSLPIELRCVSLSFSFLILCFTGQSMQSC